MSQECKPRSLGMIAWISFNLDSGRTVVIATKRNCGDMNRHGGDEGFMIFWHAELLGWIICRKQGTEKKVESALAYETDVPDLHGPIWISWTWFPQGISVRRILDCKLFAEDLVIGHR